MEKSLQFVGIIAAAMLWLAGCASPARKSSDSAGQRSDKSRTAGEVLSSEETERRAEAHAHYAAGVVHDWNEEWDQAAGEYYAAALADPDNELLVLDASHRLVQMKKFEKALEVLNKAAGRPRASGSLFAQIGRIQGLQGNKEAAQQSYRAAIKRSPRSILGYRYLAQLHLQNREHNEALKVLDQASRQNNSDATFLIELGDLYTAFIRSKPDDALKARALGLFERAAKQSPTNVFWLQTLADGFAAVGESDKAMEIYLKLIERRPVLPGIREKLTEMYLRKQDRKKAVEQLQAIIRDNPVSPQAYYLLGSLAFEDKDFKSAIDSFRKTVLLNSTFEPAYYDLAATQLNMKQPRDALITLERARGKFKETFPTEFYSAMAYAALKDFTNAVKHLTAAEIIARATETNRLNEKLFFQIGSAYERIQKFDEAEKYFRKCLELKPEYPEALNYLGYMWADRGTNLTEAKELIEKAIKFEPKNAAYLDSMAWVLYKLDNPEAALSWQLQALQYTEEPDPTLYDHLGDIYAALKQRDKAREAWQKAISLEPNQQIQKKLESDTASESGPR